MCAVEVCHAADFARVTDVRYWSLGDVTRVAVEVSSDFRYRYDRLSNPERLFYDIQGARPNMAPKGTHLIQVGDKLLRQIRVAETQPGVTRIVLDLEVAAIVSASQLSSPDRLIIELRAKERSSPPITTPPLTTSVTGGKELATVTTVDPEPVKKPEPVNKPELVNKLEARAVASSAPRVIAQPAVETTPSALPAAVPVAMPAAAPEPVRKAAVPDALPAKRNTSGDRSLTRALGLKLGRVVLDPGHGGHDVGTHGPSGLYEKDLVLDVAQRLGALIEERLGSEVVYTRSDDTFIPLEERTMLANEHKADLFLSIHANSSPYRSAAGVETYVLNFTTSKMAMDLAARENASSPRSLFDLQELAQKIALRDKADESREFAARLQTALSALSTRSNDNAKNRGVKRAPFVVLIGASMPSVLAEIGFLTNASDEALLRKTEHRQKIAEALYKGVASYAETLSHFTIAKQ
jgi:N-acetylmuramoyl-L-alanine amidase